MMNIIKKEECCGCESCVQVCPQKCIAMVEDQEGFCYPEVDYSSCMECGLCEKCCPVRLAKPENDEIVKAYVAYAKDEVVRKESSSGGIFKLLADRILQDKGIVFGAAFDDCSEVCHIGVNTSKELKSLQGSKYVQSRIKNTYLETEKNLKEGKKVLFTGTACQISGLKAFLKKEYNNLITVDVLCHGVPSPKIWRKYVEEREKEFDSSLQQAFFRQKEFGWKKFAVEFLFSNSTAYKKIYQEDPYMKLFLRNAILRPSCYACKFKGLKRQSDITLGDCWGIEKYMPEMDDDKGTSIVFTHSPKGEIFFATIYASICVKQAEIDVILPKSSESRYSVKPHKKRGQIFKRIDVVSIQDLQRLTEPRVKEKIYWKMQSILHRKGKI